MSDPYFARDLKAGQVISYRNVPWKISSVRQVEVDTFLHLIEPGGFLRTDVVLPGEEAVRVLPGPVENHLWSASDRDYAQAAVPGPKFSILLGDGTVPSGALWSFDTPQHAQDFIDNRLRMIRPRETDIRWSDATVFDCMTNSVVV